MRTIRAPGIQLNEIDRSQYNSTFNSNTTVLAMGFADKGDDYEPKFILDLNDFINSYGYPTNEAERYFYNTAKETFRYGGSLIAAKLPYDNYSLDRFAYSTYFVEDPTEDILEDYPELSIIEDIKVQRRIQTHKREEIEFETIRAIVEYLDSKGIDTTGVEDLATLRECVNRNYGSHLTAENTIHDICNVLGADEQELLYSGLMKMTYLDQLTTGEVKTHPNTFTIVDITRGKYSRDENIKEVDGTTNQYVGILPVVTTPVNAMFLQNILTSAENFSNYNAVGSCIVPIFDPYGKNNVPTLSSTYFTIELSSDDQNTETLGTMAASYFPGMKFLDESHLESEYLDKVGIVVFKMYVDPANDNKIGFMPVESFVGSFDRKAKNRVTNESMFMDSVVNSTSKFIRVFSNVQCDKQFDVYTVKDQCPISLGFYQSDTLKEISFEKSISNAMKLIFGKLEDTNSINIDLVVDAGISNIAQYIKFRTTNSSKAFLYDPSVDDIKFDMQKNNLSGWKTILKNFDQFCSYDRKDCMFIADGPRQLCLTGNQTIVRKFNPEASVKNKILPNIRYLNVLNTSYAAGYLNWFYCLDDNSMSMIWLPPSIKALGVYLYCDQAFNVWDAPAGINRGNIIDAYAVAFNPTIKEAGTLYDANWNYAISYPLQGPVLEGQKTFQKNLTAFDRVNVRRLFLACEKSISMLARNFLYEGLTVRNIQRCNDLINEFMAKVKLNDGCVDYTVICDSRNNTTETIDNNELHISVGIKPTKTAEFIILNFICTNQAANVEEITEQSI